MSAKPDRLALMETFVRIVEAGSLSAAAKQLGTTQPTVSRRLHALESSLGLRLLQRTTHAIQLTEAGQSYFARGKGLLTDLEGFEAELRGSGEAPEGLLRVVAPHAFGQGQLMPFVCTYLTRYPKMTVEWRLHDNWQRLVEGGIDCAIRAGGSDEESVVAHRIHEVPRIVVGAPSLVQGRTFTRPAQLASLPWLAQLPYYRNNVRLESERRGSSSFRIHPRLVTDSLFSHHQAALAGIGLGVMSRWIVEEDLAAGRLVHLLPRWHSQPLPVHIVYPHARFYPAKLRVFVEIMRHAFKS